MALKATLTAEEHAALPEALRTIYVAGQDGKSFVLDADVEGHPAVAGLKNTVGATREERDRIKTELQTLRTSYEGIDVKAAREAMDKIRKLEEKNLIDEGKIEELFNQRTDRMRKDHDNQIKQLQKNVEERDGMIKSLNNKLAEVLIDSGLEAAALKIGVRPAALPDVKSRGRMVWQLRDGNPTPVRGDQIIFGKDGKGPMTMEEWVTALQQDAPHLFEENRGGRTEPTLSRVSGNGKAVTLTREQARDPRTYRDAADRATKEGAQLVISD